MTCVTSGSKLTSLLVGHWKRLPFICQHLEGKIGCFFMVKFPAFVGAVISTPASVPLIRIQKPQTLFAYERFDCFTKWEYLLGRYRWLRSQPSFPCKEQEFQQDKWISSTIIKAHSLNGPTKIHLLGVSVSFFLGGVSSFGFDRNFKI